MSTEESVRIQLEGRVERLERAVKDWEAAAGELASLRWRRGKVWPRLGGDPTALDESLERTQHKAGDVPQLAALVRRIRDSRTIVEVRITSILSASGADVSGRSVGALIALLAKEKTILFTRNPQRLLVLGTFLVANFIGAMGFAGQGELMWWLPSLVGAFFVARYVTSAVPFVRLTAGSLTVGDQMVHLTVLTSVEYDEEKQTLSFSRRGTSDRKTVHCSQRPDLLMEQLTALGVRCR